MAKKRMTPLQEQASKGGLARAKALTSKQRSEIARKAINTRWEKAGKPQPPTATHAGILQIGNAEIQCYVLEDGSRILSTRGMMKALGRRWRGRKYAGTDLPVFIEARNLKPFIGKELSAVLSEVVFRAPTGVRMEGFKAEILPMVCEAYMEARDEGALTAAQLGLAKQCEILFRGLAHVGIIALVDEATGFQDDRARDYLARILEAFVSKELRRWVKTFPAEFYKQLCRLRGLPYSERTNLPQYFGHLTNDIIYNRLAPGVKSELRSRNPVLPAGYRKTKHHQWLTPHIGHPKLLEHLAAVIAVMTISDDWDEFKKNLDKAKPVWEPLPLFDQVSDALPSSSSVV